MKFIQLTATPLIAAGMLAYAVLPALAEEAGRYTMQPIEEGFLRLDTRTGAVSVCSGEGKDWSCTPASDERSDLEDENAQLRADNAVLREQIADLGAKPRVTTPEDVDAAMDAFETVAERFGKIIKIMRREMEELDEDLNAPAEDTEMPPEGEPL
jgi:hypothetical protein